MEGRLMLLLMIMMMMNMMMIMMTSLQHAIKLFTQLFQLIPKLV